MKTLTSHKRYTNQFNKLSREFVTFLDVLQSERDWSVQSDDAGLPDDDRIGRAAAVKVAVGDDPSDLWRHGTGERMRERVLVLQTVSPADVTVHVVFLQQQWWRHSRTSSVGLTNAGDQPWSTLLSPSPSALLPVSQQHVTKFHAVCCKRWTVLRQKCQKPEKKLLFRLRVSRKLWVSALGRTIWSLTNTALRIGLDSQNVHC